MTTAAVQTLLHYRTRAAAISWLHRHRITSPGFGPDGQKTWPTDRVQWQHRHPAGRGRRTDLLPTRVDHPVDDPAARAWLDRNTATLHAAAEHLVFLHREDLLALTPRPRRVALARCIDAVGEHADSRQPSPALAQALAVCLAAIQPDREVLEAAYPAAWAALAEADRLLWPTGHVDPTESQA